MIPNTTSELFIRALFDVSFYVIWSIIGLNIVLGSIVNNFIELRAKNVSKNDIDSCVITFISLSVITQKILRIFVLYVIFHAMNLREEGR